MSSKPNRSGNLIVQAALILAVGGSFLWLNADFHAPPRFDGAGYAVLALSLLDGQGYREIDHPNAPRHAHFPPGYPLVLAGVWSATGPSTLAAHTLSAVCTLAAILLAWLMFRSWFDPKVALLLALALAVNWRWDRDGTAIQSEPLFLLLSEAAVLTAMRLQKQQRVWISVALGFLLAANILTRHVGIALAAAIIGNLLTRRKFHEAGTATAAAAIIVAPWVVWLATVRINTQVALFHPTDFPSTITSNALFYLRRIIDQIIGPVVEVATVFRPQFANWATLGAAIAACPILAGWIHTARPTPRNQQLAALVPITTLILLVIWPFTEAGRFLVPLIPFIIAGLMEGIAIFFAYCRIRKARRLASAIVLLISVPYSIYAIVTHRSAAARDHHEFDTACAWIAKQESLGPVLTRHPGEVFWQTRHTAVSATSENIDSLLHDYQVAYLLIENERFAEARETPLGHFVSEHPERVEQAFISKGTRPVLVYRVKNPH